MRPQWLLCTLDTVLDKESGWEDQLHLEPIGGSLGKKDCINLEGSEVVVLTTESFKFLLESVLEYPSNNEEADHVIRSWASVRESFLKNTKQENDNG